jgi:hypothetical protein
MRKKRIDRIVNRAGRSMSKTRKRTTRTIFLAADPAGRSMNRRRKKKTIAHAESLARAKEAGGGRSRSRF